MNQTRRAFTRFELAALLAGIPLLALIVVPCLANTRPRTDRVACLNNLRLIGRAEHLWAADHDDQMPWWVRMSEGGTQGSVLQNNAWFNYGTMTNELATPAILACPSDPGSRVTHNFSALPDGFFHSGNKNNSVSYFIGLHVVLTHLPAGSSVSPSMVAQKALAGDRNLQPNFVNVICASGVTIAAGVYGRRAGGSGAHWTNAIHGTLGNLLMIDGRVDQNSNQRVTDEIVPPTDDNANTHLLFPH